jgi:hypothetical protein
MTCAAGCRVTALAGTRLRRAGRRILYTQLTLSAESHPAEADLEHANRRLGRSRFETPAAQRDDRWSRPSREIRPICTRTVRSVLSIGACRIG